MRKKLLSNVMLLLAMLFVGVGSAWAGEEVCYTLMPEAGSNNSYAGNCDITIDGITWNLTGNSQMIPWRIGGKNLSGVDRDLYSKTPMGEAITKVEVSIGNVNLTNVNSAKLIIASDADFANVIETVTKAAVSANSTLEFTPSEVTEWAKNAYYKFTFNVSAPSSNKFLEFSEAKFYKNVDESDTRLDATLSFGETTAFTVAPNATFTAPALTTNPAGLTVTYSVTDNNDIASVDENTGAVTIGSEEGTVTITASFAGNTEYKPATATYTIKVQDPKGHELAQPYTVAEALAYIATVGQTISTDKVYVSGIVSQISSIKTGDSDGYATYFISDDGQTANELEIYKGYGLNGAKFTSSDDLAVGDEVIVSGYVVNYQGTTPEFTAGSTIEYFNRPGVQQQDPTITVSDATIAFGETFTVDETAITGGAITVTSGNNEIATVSGLVITPKAVGTVVITVATDESASYYAGQETFTLTITAPEGLTVAPAAAGETVEFDFTSNDDWGLPEGSSNKTVDEASYTNGTYTIKVAGSTGNGYYWNTSGYLLMGKSGATLTLPAFNKAVVQIDVVGTGGASTSVVQNIYVGDEAVSTETTGAKDVTNEYAIASEYQAAGNVYILKVTSAHNTQISKIVVHFAGTGAYTESVSLNASGYATYASKYPLDFTNASDYSAWAITAVEGSTITFSQISGAVKGGEGILLKGEASASVEIASADCDDAFAGNLLEGTLAPTYVAADKYFGLSGDSFVKVNAGTVKAGKAILPAAAISSNVKALTFVFNGTDGIQTVETVSVEDAAQIFDLAGRRLAQPRKGVNIVNGKKVLVK